MGCISVQHKCCLHSMVAVTFLLLASLTSKCADTSDGTASALAIFVCLYQQNLFWYQQDPYIPTGAKLYLQNPKGTHTVNMPLSEPHGTKNCSQGKPQNLNKKSTLVQVMAWCCQAQSHYLSQPWPKSMLPCGITRPQWVNLCDAECFRRHENVTEFISILSLRNWYR